MKLQLKMLGVGFLLVLGVNLVFSIPYAVSGVLYNAGVEPNFGVYYVIHLICVFGRLIGLVFAGVLLSTWRNRWVAFSPSEYHSTASDFVQKHLLLLLGLFAAACIFWQGWMDFVLLSCKCFDNGYRWDKDSGG